LTRVACQVCYGDVAHICNRFTFSIQNTANRPILSELLFKLNFVRKEESRSKQPNAL